MTRKDALRRAGLLDSKSRDEIRSHLFRAPRELFGDVRAYLILRCNEMDQKQNPHQLLKLREEINGMGLIVLGPAFDKGATPEHLYLDSGARLSFGITLRKRDRASQLISFRFHYQMREGFSPEYIRFDLNEAAHPDPLSEPSCHIHPGLENVRLPLPIFDPVEVLDRIFYCLETPG